MKILKSKAYTKLIIELEKEPRSSYKLSKDLNKSQGALHSQLKTLVKNHMLIKKTTKDVRKTIIYSVNWTTISELFRDHILKKTEKLDEKEKALKIIEEINFLLITDYLKQIITHIGLYTLFEFFEEFLSSAFKSRIMFHYSKFYKDYTDFFTDRLQSITENERKNIEKKIMKDKIVSELAKIELLSQMLNKQNKNESTYFMTTLE